MGARNGRHEIGDIVTPTTEKSLFGGKRKTPKGLKKGTHYRIKHIDRCLDGAYSWDNIFLEGKKDMFCEFDLDTVERR